MAARKPAPKKPAPKKSASKPAPKAARKAPPAEAASPKKSPVASHEKVRVALRKLGLGLPGAHEDFPWGESVLKVSGKVFLFMGVAGSETLGLGVKLPESSTSALALPCCEPAGYGLGKSGWVSCKFPADQDPPLELLTNWMLESYRAVAPKKLLAQAFPAK